MVAASSPPSTCCFSIISLIGRYLRRCLISAGLTSHTVEIDGGETTIHLWGPPAPTNKPAIVLIHGFGPPGAWQWRSQVAFFAKEYDVYMPDLLFFGESFTSSGERSEVFQAACLAKVLLKLGVSRYSLIGTSYGGFVAYRIAKMWPERVEKVVIASSALNMKPNDNVELIKKVNARCIENVLMPQTASELRAMLKLCIYKAPYMPDCFLNDFLDKLFCENRKEKMELLKELTIGKDDFTYLTITPIQQEVLIVWGDHDQIFLLDKAIDLHKSLGKKARLEVIKKTAHTPQIERSGQFNKVVSNFLNE